MRRRAVFRYYGHGSIILKTIRTVQPQGPYALGGLCFGGVIAFEMAQQLRINGEPVSLVALLDSGIKASYETQTDGGFVLKPFRKSFRLGSSAR